MKFRAGDIVKIADVGTLARVIEARGRKAFLELDGEKFWIQTRFVERIETEAA